MTLQAPSNPLHAYLTTYCNTSQVKFFESDSVEDSECYLLRMLSIEYRRIVEMLAARAHAEHEKDFAFKYLPFILANGVYFGFYYVFPGECLRWFGYSVCCVCLMPPPPVSPMHVYRAMQGPATSTRRGFARPSTCRLSRSCTASRCAPPPSRYCAARTYFVCQYAAA